MGHIQIEKEKIAWQTLATFNQLEFIADDLRRQGARVVGNFRRHKLKLFTHREGEGKGGQVYTCLEFVTANSTVYSSTYKRNGANEPMIVINDQEINLQEAVNQLALTISDQALRGKVKFREYCRGLSYQQPGVETDINYLH